MTRPSLPRLEFGPNLTPLVDVVMVILIFLMLAGTLNSDRYLPSRIPLTRPGGTGYTINSIPDEPLEIRVNPPFLAGNSPPYAFYARAGGLTTSDPTRLDAELNRIHARLNAAGVKDENIQVFINPGVDVKYQSLVRVYEAALRGKFTKIGFKTAH